MFLDFFSKSLVEGIYVGKYIYLKKSLFHKEGPDFLQHTVKDARAFHRQNSFCSVSGQLE